MKRNEYWTGLPLRLVIEFGFAVHGWAKFSKGPEGFANVEDLTWFIE